MSHRTIAWLLTGAALFVCSARLEVAAREPDSSSFQIAVIGDLNGAYGTVGYSNHVRVAVRRLLELHPDLVIGVGDLIAGQQISPLFDRDHLEAMWRTFHREITEPLAAAGIPFIPVVGNHDGSAEPAFVLERMVFSEQWMGRRPAVEFVDDQGYPFNYAVAAGGSLIIILDAATVGPISQMQRAWVENTLDRAASYRTRLVAAHLPIHAFAYGREHETIADHGLEKVLRKGSVDLFLSGHHHAFFPGFYSGFLQVSQGCLGAGARRLLGAPQRSPRSFTVVEISSEGSIALLALAEPDFTERIHRSSLPSSIRFGGVEIPRDDVAARESLQ